MSAQKRIKTEDIASPKGMRDITGELYFDYQGFFEKAQEVASYYGFQPIELPIIERELIFTTTIEEGTDIVDKEMYTLRPPKSRDKLALRPEGTAGAVRAYIERGMQSMPQPVMLYYYGPFFRHDKPQKGRYREFRQFGLEIIGAEQAITDALIIKVNMLMLEEAGANNIAVKINSIGNNECRVNYIKELTAYYRKNIEKIGKLDKQRLKTNPLRILDSKDPNTMEVNEGAPDSISFLSTDCKKHFKKVLEYLEEMKIPYQIDKALVRGLSYYTDTVFEIFEDITDEDGKVETVVYGGGGRYDYLAKTLGFKKDLPAVGSALGVDRIVEAKWYKHLKPRIIKKPKFYFIQLGIEAKMKSMSVIEILRKAKVGVKQSLSKDKLSVQLGIAEKLKVPYTLIFGQKEALDGKIIVRSMDTRSQKSIEIENLSEYIKTLK
jgi:histidyl-tRNA synthetase